MRVGGLTGRGSDEFDCGVGEHDAGHDNHQREDAGGEKSAVIRDHAETGWLPLNWVAAGKEDGARNQKCHQRNDLDERSPELELPEHGYRDHVQAHHGREREQCQHPLRTLVSPDQ